MARLFQWVRNAQSKTESEEIKPCPFCGNKPEVSFSFTSCGYGLDHKWYARETMAIVCRTIGCPMRDVRVPGHRILAYSESKSEFENELLDYEPNMELIAKWNKRAMEKGDRSRRKKQPL